VALDEPPSIITGLTPVACDGDALSGGDYSARSLGSGGGQFKQAKEAGLPTALLLDQVPRPGGKSYTVWIAGPNTVAAVVAAILRDHDGKNSKVLDQVWLRPASPTSPLDIPSLHLLIA
jgi:hypothetical protein